MRVRSDIPRSTHTSAWRRRLTTAAVAVLAGGILVVAAPAPAGASATLPGGSTVAGDVGSATVGTPDAGAGFAPPVAQAGGYVSTVTLNAPRTILHMSGFDLTAGNSLNLVFGGSDPSDLVLIEVDGTANINGNLNAFLGTDGGTVGGNVWIRATNGVFFGGNARVDVGGFLATTAQIEPADFLGSNFNFSNAVAGTGVEMNGAATITGRGNLIALVAPRVLQGSEAVVTSASSRSEVLYGGAAGFHLDLASEYPGSPLELLSFVVPSDIPGPSGVQHSTSVSTPVDLNGTTVAADVFVASVASSSSAGLHLGGLTVDGAPASGDGHLVVAAGAGIARDTRGDPMQAVATAGAVPNSLVIDGAMTADHSARLLATGDLAVQQPITTGPGGAGNTAVLTAGGDLTLGARVATETAVLSTGGTFTNPGGAANVAVPGGRWIVYAPAPANVPSGTGALDSGQTAIWNADLVRRPPATVSGNRYVFAFSPVVTFTADYKYKDFDIAYATGMPLLLTAGSDDYVHPGVAGLFRGDTAPAWTGAPTLSSPGASHTAPDRGGSYPIAISPAGLSSPLGYSFAVLPNVLFVDDNSPPEVTPSVDGTLGDNGWYTGDVAVSFTVVDIGSDPVQQGAGCAGRTVAADQDDESYTCTAESFGGVTTASTLAVRRDAIAPELDITATVPGGSYTAGSWTNLPVTVDFDCTDNLSGVATQPADGLLVTATQAVEGTCVDRAGTPGRATFQVNIDTIDPIVGPSSATTATGPYSAGTWTDEDVTVTWTCTDTGGSGVATPVSVTASTSRLATPVCVDAAGNSATGPPLQVNIDTEAPTLSGVPDGRSATTTGTSAVVSWPAPSATDDQDDPPVVTCNPPSGSSFPLGTTTVTCSATDHAGHVATSTFPVTVRAVTAGATFDRPIDASPVTNLVKLGRVIPVKALVTVDGAPVTGPSILPVHLQASSISCTLTGAEDSVEVYAAGSSNAGNLLRWDASAGRWTYNLDTSAFGLQANSCYRVSVYYGGTVVGGTAAGGVLTGFFYLQPKR